MTDALTCGRCGRSGDPLDKPPFRGTLGDRIHRSVCRSCWSEWQAQQTRIINELRLSLGDPRGQQILDREMRAFLNLDGPAEPPR